MNTPDMDNDWEWDRLGDLRAERRDLEMRLAEAREGWLREWKRLTEDMPPLLDDDGEPGPGDAPRRPASRKQGAGHPARRGRG